MICPKCPPERPILVKHFHYPEWVRLAKLGDWSSRMMLLVWWPERRPRKFSQES